MLLKQKQRTVRRGRVSPTEDLTSHSDLKKLSSYRKYLQEGALFC